VVGLINMRLLLHL